MGELGAHGLSRPQVQNTLIFQWKCTPTLSFSSSNLSKFFGCGLRTMMHIPKYILFLVIMRYNRGPTTIPLTDRIVTHSSTTRQNNGSHHLLNLRASAPDRHTRRPAAEIQGSHQEAHFWLPTRTQYGSANTQGPPKVSPATPLLPYSSGPWLCPPTDLLSG
jgi:hypothetical protein